MGGQCLCISYSTITTTNSLGNSSFSIDSERMYKIIQCIPEELERQMKNQFEVCLISNEINQIQEILDHYKQNRLLVQTHYQRGGQQILNQGPIKEGPIIQVTIITFQNISFQKMYKQFVTLQNDKKLNLEKCNLHNKLYNRNIALEKYLIGQFNQLLENQTIKKVLQDQIYIWKNYENNDKLQQSIYFTIWMLAQLFLAHQKHQQFSQEIHLYLYQQMLSVQIFYNLRNRFFDQQAFKKTSDKILDKIFDCDSPIEKYNVLHYLFDQKNCKSKECILTYLQKYKNKRLLYNQIKFIQLYLGIYQDIPKQYFEILNIWEESTKVFSLIQQQQ